MTRTSLLKFAAGVLVATAVAAAAAAVIIPRLLDLEAYRGQILSMARKSLDRPVSYQSATLSWGFGPSFTFTGISIQEKSGGKPLLTADRLRFSLAILPLLRKEVRLQGIELERPVLDLARDDTGLTNISDLFTGKPSGSNVQIRSVRIRNGLVRFRDRLYDPDGLTTTLENLDLYVSSLARGSTSDVKLSTRIPQNDGQAEISLSGTVRIPSPGEPAGNAKGDLALSAKGVDAGRYWPYYGRFLPMGKIRGNLDMEASFRGKPAEFTTKGSLKVRGLRLRYPEVFHAPLEPKELQISYDVARDLRRLSVNSLELTVDGFRLQGNCALDDMQTDDPRIRARATTSSFRLEGFRHYIPFGIIPKGTADFIQQRIKGGVFRLTEGAVDGRLSQLRHMGGGDNSGVLSVRIRVDDGVLTLGPKVPDVTTISGELEMTGKDFSLHRMTGRFGNSPFTLDGKIAGYTLDSPSEYPVTLAITPASSEVAWLFRQDDPGALAFSGPSTLTLSGTGTAADYWITGSWDLSRAAYHIPRLLDKPPGLANRLAFSVHLGATEARLSELRYGLPPLELTASATYRYGREAPLTFTATTNQFTLAPDSPLFPKLKTFHPAGKLRAGITGEGNPAQGDTVRVKGALSLVGFSLRPLKQIAPLSGMEGTINFTEASLETGQMTGRVGDSGVTVKGRVTEFSDPAVDMAFASPFLHLKDIGFQSPGEDPQVKDLSGSISLKKGNLTVNSLSGVVERTAFAAQGEVLDLKNPQVALRIDLPHLRVEDLEPLTRLKRVGTATGSPGAMTLKTRVTLGKGSFRDIPFEKLDGDISLENDRLDVRSVTTTIFGGTVAGSGKADLAATEGPLYQATYRLAGVDAAQILAAAGREEKLTGRLTAEGNLTTGGNSAEELRKNTQVTAKLHLRDGGFYGTGAVTGARVDIPYTFLDGELTLQKDILTIEGLKAGALGGTVAGGGRVDFAAEGGPRYQATFSLDHLDTARLLALAGRGEKVTGFLTAEGELTARGNDADGLKKTVRGDADITLSEGTIPFPPSTGQGKGGVIPFKELQAHLSYEGNVLQVPAARIEAFGGITHGYGTADFRLPDGPGYTVGCQMENIDAANLFNTLGTTKEVSGRMTLLGDLTARGDTGPTLKKTLQGSVGVLLEKGVINKYEFLSKIFSILNVSQLLDFRLPDMVSNGMPYDRITGSFSLHDGSASTSNLTMNSPSINVTVVGKSDLVKEELDVTVGVQPLQTVSKIVRHIPIVGWILTGGDKSFLVTYYEAKGPWNNPKVAAIPVSSLSQGVFNIFKRTFTLPGKLITDTGGVFMDK